MSSHEDDYYTDLISVVAHDLKTPISAVKGFIDLVQQAGPLNERQQHFSDRALASLDRMEHLIADLLEYTRINRGMKMEPIECDVRGLVADAVELVEELAARREVTIHVHDKSGSLMVMADVRLLSEVLNNLIGNAVKYNRDGGKVDVTVSHDDDNVRVDVRDTGIGIAPDDVPHVFERFFRAKGDSASRVEGSGLGLAIAESVIRQHGGRIWAESVEGEGSTFSFTLPVQGKPSD